MRMLIYRSKNIQIIEKQSVIKNLSNLNMRRKDSIGRHYIYYYFGMQLSKEKKNNTKHDTQLIQNTYVIYTPKIIKFVYKGNQKKLNQKAYLDSQMKFSDISHVVRSQIISKNLSESNHSKISSRVGKIQLVSSKKQIIRLKGKGKQKRSKTEHSQLQNNLKQSHLKLPQYKDHISTVGFVESFGCDFFSECNDNSNIDVNQRMPFSSDNSRKTFQQSEMLKREAKLDGISIKKQQDENSQSNGKSLYDFKKRKNIFAQLNLNKSFDLAYKQRDRSHSRKSIFQQRIKLCDLNFSKDRSTSTNRKRIFEGFAEQKSRITVKSHEQQLEECQIPKSIYSQWQKFSPQSERKQIVQNRCILQTVQQLRLQQSQVKLID